MNDKKTMEGQEVEKIGVHPPVGSRPLLCDGMISFGSNEAELLGLTPDKFEGTWLWKDGNTIIISFIISRAKGNFKALVDRIRSLGFAVEIPTPLGRMQEIVSKNGYRHEVKNSEMGPVDVWILDA